MKLDPAWLDVLAPRGMSKRIGPEKGRSVPDGISIFRSPYGSVRYLLSERGEPIAALQLVVMGDRVVASSVLVVPRRRREGLASKLFDRALRDYSTIIFDQHLTDDGVAWTRAVEKRRK